MNEIPVSSWKSCCVYDCKKAFKDSAVTIPVKGQESSPVSGLYTIQGGDTFLSIFFKEKKEGLTVEDLIAANPGLKPTELKVGQTLKLRAAKNSYTPVADAPKKEKL